MKNKQIICVDCGSNKCWSYGTYSYCFRCNSRVDLIVKLRKIRKNKLERILNGK
jgi:hypothetical protein